MAQSVKCPTLAQVTISGFVSSSPMWGSVLIAQSLEPALDSVSLSLSAPPLLTYSLSLKNKETLKKKRTKFAMINVERTSKKDDEEAIG